MSYHRSHHTLFLFFLVANRFCQEYGCVRLSMGEVLRRQISSFPKSTLAEIILSHLKAGKVVPDDICALALESALLDIQCATRGYKFNFFLH